MKERGFKILSEKLSESFAKYADEIALEFSDRSFTYKELDETSENISSYLLAEKKEEAFIGVYAEKTFFVYASIVGIIRAGKAYVPLNPKFPAERNAEIIKLSGIKSIAGNSTGGIISSLKQKKINDITFSGENILKNTFHVSPINSSEDDAAYLLFTSGSTGVPKGVEVTNKNLAAYLTNILPLTKTAKGNKCSQTFDLTFDLSVHDIFCALTTGATLCIPSENELLSPSSYIKNRGITHWFSVPSFAVMMDKLRQLKENNFSSLQSVLFCGEALPVSIAEKFMKSAPNASFNNLYGPTEATIAISSCSLTLPLPEKNSTVCIGKIFTGNNFFLLDENGNRSSKGELFLSGEQVIKKYFKNPDADANCFLEDKEMIRWYNTGDIIERDEENNLYYIGRKDTQIKLNGFRIELGEITAVLISESGNSNGLCFVKDDRQSKILVAVLEGEKQIDNAVLLAKCREKLPAYMLPQQIVYLPGFPLNANGKTDRNAVIKMAGETK